jgi:GT2 family glycosyltransferase
MVGIILINYNNYEETTFYIKNELSKIKINKKIIVVDNSCSSAEYKRLTKSCEKIKDLHLIKAKDNLGYAKGNNLGAKFLLEKYNLKFLLFSNTDIQIYDSDVVEYLIGKMSASAAIAACNPEIVSQDGKLTQSPFKYVPFYKVFVLKKILYPFMRKKIESGLWSDLISDANEGVYYRLSGAFLLVNKEDFITAGMFDENTFLFAEESILSERFKRNGKSCAYYPDKKIIHEIHGTIGKFNESDQISKLMLRSNFYYQRNYKNIPQYLYFVSLLSWFVYYKVYKAIFIYFRKK